MIAPGGRRAALRRRIDRWLGRPIPEPPEALRAGVGGGDWRSTGEETARLVIELGGLERDHRVLDLGCGLGRLVQPLREYLSRRASYLGLDIAHQYIAWNRNEIETRDPRFRFAHLDVRNDAYRPEGSIDASRAELPAANGAFDFAIATSLFTHLRAAEAEHYLRELARVLVPGGRLFATFFLLDAESRRRIDAGRADRRFAHPMPHGATDDEALPERAIAFEQDWLLGGVESAGFRLAHPVRRGQWCGESEGATYQDLLVATRTLG